MTTPQELKLIKQIRNAATIALKTRTFAGRYTHSELTTALITHILTSAARVAGHRHPYTDEETALFHLITKEAEVAFHVQALIAKKARMDAKRGTYA